MNPLPPDTPNIGYPPGMGIKQMNATLYVVRCCTAVVLPLVWLTGCANRPIRHATSELLSSSTFTTFAPDVVQPMLKHRVPPRYPLELNGERVSGVVQINCLVDENGLVTDALVEKASDNRFIPEALLSVRKWIFSPGLRDGRPAMMRVRVPVCFIATDSTQTTAARKNPPLLP